ncbi:MAG: peptidase M3 [Bacteroidetes bacterium]|nr:peptidase M3 [Bacteroidota bacterium]
MCCLGLFVLAACTQQKEVKNENPFFAEYQTPYGVPPFDLVKMEHYMPAIEEGLNQEKAEVEAILTNPEAPTFENTVVAYTRTGEFLGKPLAVLFGLSSANTTPEIQALVKEVSPMLSAHNDAIRLDPRLFERIEAVYNQKEALNLEADQLYLLENLYKGFVRSGAKLEGEAKEELMAINQRMSAIGVQFGQNLLGETNDFQLIIDKEEDLAGLPENIKIAGAEAAKRADQEGKWLYTTQRSSMYPFLTYAENRELRKQLYTAYQKRGDNDNERDNKAIAAERTNLRVRKAQLLGYESHADLILESRMAKTSERVYELLDRVWWPALELAKKEVKEMQAIADAEGANIKIEAWDWWHYAEKVRKAKYNLDEAAIAPYFSRENVQKAIFYVANQLYGITFEEIKDAPLPHPDAHLHLVKEADGTPIAVMYQDYFARPSKRGGAWCGSYRGYKIDDEGNKTIPVITFVTNAPGPIGDAPALMSLTNVTTVFHEFGHALDGIFSNIRYQTSFRARDFTEMPAQIMEHFAFQPEVLKVYAKHYETGEVIPDELIEKINKSALFNQGFITVEYVAASLIDMEYHSLTEEKEIDVRKFEKEFFAKRKLIPEIAPRYRTTYFSHINGGYSAGYYGYMWSGVLDNDGFEAFKETSLFDQETAQRFRKYVLEPNGLQDPDEMYKNFRGRAPIIEPLLRSRGLIK